MNRSVTVNSDIVILSRNGMVFATKLAGNFKPFPLQELDMILLFLCLKAVAPEQVASHFKKNVFAKKLGAANIPHTQITIRVQQLLECGLLSATSVETIKKLSGSSSVWKKKNQAGQPVAKKLRVSTNFALIPEAGTFKVWSVKKRCFYWLDLESILLLNLWAKENHLSEFMRQGERFFQKKIVKQGLSNLLDVGLLVAEPKEIAAVTKKSSEQIPELVNNGISWQQLAPDGRIPVYFVTHMQNHYPLALGMLFSSIQSYSKGALLEKFQLIPITYFEPADLLNGPYRKFGKGIWLFSNYMWSLELNLQISASVKTHMKGNLTIHGGPSTPNYADKCTEFLTHNTSVDIAVHGEGEVSIVEILSNLQQLQNGDVFFNVAQLKAVPGITFVAHEDQLRNFVRTEGRSRLKDLQVVPSPYLDGVFDVYNARVDAAIIETNRGCPFGCTFCDWGSATNQKIRKFDLGRVKKEIDWIGRNKVRVLWVADANFGLYDRDIELSVAIIEAKAKYGFPQEVVVNYTKNSTWRLAEIIKIFTQGGIISQGIISIQTADEETLKVINRKNIKVEKYDELLGIFAEMNLPLSTDLMIGLPGITIETFNQDLQRYIDVDVSVKAYPTQLLPNSPMADPEYIQKYKIKVDKNNFLISTHSYTESDLLTMKAMFRIYTAADGYGLLRYVLRYLQWEHKLNAMSFLTVIQQEIKSRPQKYPHITFAFNFFETEKCMPCGWKVFYDEIASLVEHHYGIKRDSAFDTVLYVNDVCMPDDAVSYPLEVELRHDFSAYFVEQKKRGGDSAKALAEYAGAKLRVTDPNAVSKVNNEYLQYDTHQYFWELDSPMARAVSTSALKNI